MPRIRGVAAAKRGATGTRSGWRRPVTTQDPPSRVARGVLSRPGTRGQGVVVAVAVAVEGEGTGRLSVTDGVGALVAPLVAGGVIVW